MGDLVNLRTARKRKKRADREKQAADNRIAFGTPKHLKKQKNAAETLDAKRLDGHRRDEAPEE